MAKNNLTPEQDLLTRRFYVEVAEKAEALLPDAPVNARNLRATLLMLLNYIQLPSGAFVEAGTDINRAFGNYWWSYWIMVSCNVFIPQVFWFRKARTSPLIMFIISIFNQTFSSDRRTCEASGCD